MRGSGELDPSKPDRSEAAIRNRAVSMVDASQPPEGIAPIFDDIKRTLGLPLVNSDYRALASWPNYLRHAWDDLKPTIASPAYQQARDQLAIAAWDAVDAFGAPVRLSTQVLVREGIPESEIDNAVQVAQLFSGLLPGLILNIAGFQRALRE